MLSSLVLIPIAIAVQTPAVSSTEPVTSTANVTATTDAGPARERFLRVAVYDFTVDQVEPRIGRFVTDALVVELRKLEGISVVSMDEVRAMLQHEAGKELVGCTGGASCLSEIGDALGVDEILVGSLATVGGASVVTMRRIDQGAAAAVGSVSERLVPSNGEEFLAEVGPAIEKLYPERRLRQGAERGVPPQQARRLNPPPLPLWAPVATGAASLGALAGAASFGVMALLEEQAHNALVAEAKETPVAGSQVVESRDRALGLATAANVMYGVTAVVGLAAAAMIPFTNFDTGAAETE